MLMFVFQCTFCLQFSSLFPSTDTRGSEGIGYFTFLGLKIKCHSSTELCLVLDEGVVHLTLLCY